MIIFIMKVSECHFIEGDEEIQKIQIKSRIFHLNETATGMNNVYIRELVRVQF